MRWRDDQGSVLVLALGLVVVALVAVVAVTDASALFLARRSLAATADAAALAGAQGVDLAAVYGGEAADTLPLDPGEARRRVERHLRAAAVPGAGVTVQLRSMRCDGTTVTVRLSAQVQLPFRSWLSPSTGTVDVVAEAAATTPLR